jgi:signal transduction histidine kinase
MLHKSSTISSFSTIDSRMVAVMRTVLAFSALLITYIDPSEPDRFVFETYLALILYSLYSLIIYLLVIRQSQFIRNFLNVSHWADVTWYLVLIALSSGTSSIFFFFFFYVILYTSFSRGFITGLSVTVISSITFTVIGYATAPSGLEFELNRFLLRPIYLIVIGYMMSYWGGYEILAKRRLALLREISTISNPRFGVDRTVGVILELLREFYSADGCLLIMADSETGNFTVRRAERGNAETAFGSYQINPQLLKKFLSPAENDAIIYNPQSKRALWRKFQFYALDLEKKEIITENRQAYEEIAERLDTSVFISVPVHFRKKFCGRLFVFTSQRDAFDKSDIDFLLQAVNQFMPIVENMRLVDHLASNAAEEERKRIARDIHDSIIQQYIGLQYGLISVGQALDMEPAGNGSVWEKRDLIKERIQKLSELTESGIENLRNYTRGLKEMGLPPEDTFLPSLQRFVLKFTNATGITVEINSKIKTPIADRLAAELFQIVVEGLSNVRKHTQSTLAVIDLEIKSDGIFLRLENDNDGAAPVSFTPISISERVEALGGFLEVKQGTEKTALSLEIPL